MADDAEAAKRREERRQGPWQEAEPPLSSKETEDCQGRGRGGARDIQRATAPEDSTSGVAVGSPLLGAADAARRRPRGRHHAPLS